MAAVGLESVEGSIVVGMEVANGIWLWIIVVGGGHQQAVKVECSSSFNTQMY